MQDDLASAYPSLDIQVLGINERGQESANSLAVADRTLPWLQDVDQNGNNVSDVWNETWQIEYRDVVVLNGANEPTFVFNLTTHDLGNATNYETLRDAMLRTAIDDQRPWCNSENFLDVDRNGLVQNADFAAVLGFLNSSGSQSLSPTATPTAHVDCDFDGFAAPIDALRVLNYLNGLILEGEGEFPAIDLEPSPSPFQPSFVSLAASPAQLDAVWAQFAVAPTTPTPALAASLESGNDFPFTLHVVPDDEAIEIAAGGEEDATASRFGDSISEADVFFRLGPAGN